MLAEELSMALVRMDRAQNWGTRQNECLETETWKPGNRVGAAPRDQRGQARAHGTRLMGSRVLRLCGRAWKSVLASNLNVQEFCTGF